jgi:hypothetical protein
MGAAEQLAALLIAALLLAALTGWWAEPEAQLAAEVVAAQVLVEGLAVVVQPGEIQLPDGARALSNA